MINKNSILDVVLILCTLIASSLSIAIYKQSIFIAFLFLFSIFPVVIYRTHLLFFLKSDDIIYNKLRYLVFIIPVFVLVYIFFKTKINWIEFFDNSIFILLSIFFLYYSPKLDRIKQQNKYNFYLTIYSIIITSICNSTLIIFFNFSSLTIFLLILIFTNLYFNTIIQKKIEINKIFFLTIFFLMMFPIFFSLKNGLFSQDHLNLNLKEGILYKPIPISLYLIILVLPFLKNQLFDRRIILFISTVYIALSLNLIGNFYNFEELKNSLINQIQNFVPFFGIFIGLYYFKNNTRLNFERLVLIFLTFFILSYLLYSLGKNWFILYPNYFGFFSIYQNYQYVSTTLIFLLMFFYLKINIISKVKFLHFIFFLILGLYAYFSSSIGNIILFYIFLILLIFYNIKRITILFKILLITVFFINYNIAIYNNPINEKRILNTINYFQNFSYQIFSEPNYVFNFIKARILSLKKDPDGTGGPPPQMIPGILHGKEIINLDAPVQVGSSGLSHKFSNILDKKDVSLGRFDIWKSYFDKLKTLKITDILFPSYNQVDVKAHESPHNYLFYILINFGLISMILLLSGFINLISFISVKVIKVVLINNPILIIFTIFVSTNFIKLTIIQPYSGILMMVFFGYFYSLLIKNVKIVN